MTWNVLADAYAYGQQHCGRQALGFEARLEKAIAAIDRARPDVAFLQEVDRLDEWRAALATVGLTEIRVATRAESYPPDACVTAWRANVATCESTRRVAYDAIVDENDRLARRYRRHNVALLCVLRRNDGDVVVVANTHLHWDPDRADVKLAQTAAFLREIEKEARGRPVIAAGDFNATPSSAPIVLALQGAARLDQCRGLLPSPGPPGRVDAREVRVVLDFNQNRLCRWLRLCGVDAVLETPEQAAERCSLSNHSNTNKPAIAIVAIAASERRLLVTGSKTLTARREVASLPHVVVTSSMSCEDAFAAVVRATRLRVVANEALTRCVRCNGDIVSLDPTQSARLRAADRDNKIPHDPSVDLFACDGCAQTFWWSERDNSSAARAKDLADKLRRRADDLDASGGFEEETSNNNPPPDRSDDLVRSLVKGVNHGLDLRSVSPLAERRGGVTNYVPQFAAQIDYIFYTKRHWSVVARRRLPTVADLKQALGRGHYLPSDAWPSDHIAVVADLRRRRRSGCTA
ncbi:hypothetical protein CTAYLR_009665 [Chrysophaeum taylorii]|uniref:Endonuclease/exonuclease/phosphatase domain-containing protein n=1 Tax=Chrysophaeum taylorii TaxID=2483200 RepID=A0AAD7UJI9_9STRA|nr:hypothetical protein CTAYLR_009665 [Chrysophaeum taylorii]